MQTAYGYMLPDDSWRMSLSDAEKNGGEKSGAEKFLSNQISKKPLVVLSRNISFSNSNPVNLLT